MMLLCHEADLVPMPYIMRALLCYLQFMPMFMHVYGLQGKCLIFVDPILHPFTHSNRMQRGRSAK